MGIKNDKNNVAYINPEDSPYNVYNKYIRQKIVIVFLAITLGVVLSGSICCLIYLKTQNMVLSNELRLIKDELQTNDQDIATFQEHN